jgi:mannosylglucosylglycerate synthase
MRVVLRKGIELAIDLVTHPSGYEGFGNALVEAVYSRRPVIVNRYPAYAKAIAPRGFRVTEIAGAVTDEAMSSGASLAGGT